jgi:hypothetical protein
MLATTPAVGRILLLLLLLLLRFALHAAHAWQKRRQRCPM